MISFRLATRADMGPILDWAASEGWNPGLDDADAFWAADSGGFFIAVENEKPVASISVVNHTDDFAFLGLYIARPEVRGRGVGLGLWQHAIAHAGSRTIGLDGVAEQQANYAASGFRAAGGTTRYSGQIAGSKDSPVQLAQPADIPTLIDREARTSGVRKEAYLRHWFMPGPHRKTILTDGGFCTVRACRQGAKIGPLIADHPAAARHLIQQAATLLGPDLILDVPDSAPDLAALCQAMGFEAGFQTARMYRGPAPAGTQTLFAVTTLELG